MKGHSFLHVIKLVSPFVMVVVLQAAIGFLQGGNHPDDVPGLIWLFRYFNRVSFLQEAIREWTATDPMLLELSVFGEVIRSELENGPIRDTNRLQFLSTRLSELNTQFTVHAKRFSTVLGEGSRAIKLTLTGINIVTAVTLILLLIWHTRRLVLQRQAFEDALHAEKERLAWQASHDWLTGLSNRRAFEARLQSELDAAAAGPLGLILLDLDQFKNVNDTCGHLAGDRLLCQVSRLLQQDRRPRDLVARLGGDEFGLILPQCSPATAVDIAERLRRSLELLNFAWDVTASIGVACIADGDTTLEDAMRRADAACYRAKEKGRNRVQVDGGRPDVIAVAARPREAVAARG